MGNEASNGVVERHTGFVAGGFDSEDQQLRASESADLPGGAWQKWRKWLLYWAFLRFLSRVRGKENSAAQLQTHSL